MKKFACQVLFGFPESYVHSTLLVPFAAAKPGRRSTFLEDKITTGLRKKD
jgi:hypothetical protein